MRALRAVHRMCQSLVYASDVFALNVSMICCRVSDVPSAVHFDVCRVDALSAGPVHSDLSSDAGWCSSSRS